MESLVQDIRYGLRSLRKTPAFTAIAALALALGIGANTVLFSVISFSLLRPLPFHEPERLLVMSERQQNFPSASVAWLNFVDWHAQADGLFSGFAAVRRESLNLTGQGEPERVLGRMATSELLPLLGVQPLAGRFYGPDEDKPGAPRTAVLTWGLWQRRFGGDPALLGKSIQLSGDSYTVIGILPRDFRFLSGVDLFVPLGLFADRYQDRGQHPGIYAFARMKAGVTLEQVRKAFDGIAARLAEAHQEQRGATVNVDLLKEDQVSDSRRALLVLWGAVAFVLLIAAANVANLLLARATARQTEIAIRVALGAGRARIVRQLLTESVLLSLLGGALGVALAAWGLDALRPYLSSLPRGKDVRLDGLALAFTMGVSLITGLGFGLYPAVRASDPSFHTLLKEVRGTGAHARLRGALIVGEVALSMVLLIGAGLLLRSFSHLTSVRPGFDADHVLTFSISLPPARYGTPDALLRFEQEFRRKAGALPGVRAAAISAGMPLLGSTETSFSFEGQVPPQGAPVPMADVYAVTPEYFEAMRIPLLQGRAFTEADRGRNLALIDEVMARRYFPNESPLGKRFANRPGQPPGAEVIGVVGHVQNYSLDGHGPVDLGFYLQYSTAARVVPQFSGNIFAAVRAAGDPGLLAQPLRRVVAEIDPDQPVYAVKTMQQAVSDSVSDRRLNLLMLGIFAAVALLLASVGIYGVMSYSVEQRTREIGIRMALGAERVAVLRLIVGQGARLAGAGIGIGLAGALLLSRVLTSLLYGVSATDPLTYAALAALLAGVAVAACWVPARRAVRVDPAIALRAE